MKEKNRRDIRLDIKEYFPEIAEIQRRGEKSFAKIAEGVRRVLRSGKKPETMSDQAFTSMMRNKTHILNSLEPGDNKERDAWDVHMYPLKEGGKEQLGMFVAGPKGSVSLPGASPEMFVANEDLYDFLRINKYRRESVDIADLYFGRKFSHAETIDDVKSIRPNPKKARELLNQILTQFPLPKK